MESNRKAGTETQASNVTLKESELKQKRGADVLNESDVEKGSEHSNESHNKKVPTTWSESIAWRVPASQIKATQPKATYDANESQPSEHQIKYVNLSLEGINASE